MDVPLGYIFESFCPEWVELDKLMSNPYIYQQNLVKYVKAGGSHDVGSMENYLGLVNDHVVKVEGLERYSKEMASFCEGIGRCLDHTGYITCHLFISTQGSVSFPEHTDPMEVILYMVDGKKEMFINGQSNIMRKGSVLNILPHEKHRAENIESSIMLSFGLERYTEEML